jgi:hypothetical protein
MLMRAYFPLVVTLSVFTPAVARAGGAPDYLRQIKPLLAEKCFSCHGALQQKGGLRLDTVKSMLEGGDDGPAIVAGQSGKSQLIERVLGKGRGRRMPPASEGEPLSASQIALLKRWIDQGAKGPSNEKPEADPRAHWAFRAPVRPPVPRVEGSASGRNPIDAFLAAERVKRGLTPQPPADRRLLLRRVYLNLIGLPPTRAEQEAFLVEASAKPQAASAQAALAKVVDRLLASPHYGERWGRHWMDVWRYSDWWGLGQEVRSSQKHMWHWRDWIVESLNADKGYDQMVREMLAADELYPDDLGRLRATGLLARHYFRFNRTTWLDETVEHTSKAFLGLTLNCTRCHDHKYDPFAQADYYRFRAFFEPYQIRLEQAPGEADYEKDGIPRVFDCNLDTPTYLFIRGDDRNPDKKRVIAPAVPRLLTWGTLDIQPVDLPAAAHQPGLRPHVLANYLRAQEKKRVASRALLARAATWAGKQGAATKAHAEKMLAAADAQATALAARAAADRAKVQGDLPAAVTKLARDAALAERRAAVAEAEENLARIASENVVLPKGKQIPEKVRAAAQSALLAARKALAKPGEQYTPLRGAQKTPESNLETGASLLRPFPTTSTGRRSALARWITDRRNPLTARVAVNHIWMRHFGRPLVETVFDFGRKGSPPSHPELLDWLAVEFMESGWSMKHLHRLMVTSEAYSLSSSSAGAAKNREFDPENRYYWRMNPVRMEAQVLRDSLLSLAGELDARLGGPSVPVQDEGSRRRSLYYVHSHNDRQRFLGTFDDASVLECYRRSESIVPQQALALSNSKLTLAMAARINERLHRQLGTMSDADFARAAFETVLASTPTAEEVSACAEALQTWQRLAKGRPDAVRRARGHLIHALLNHNDFITVR